MDSLQKYSLYLYCFSLNFEKWDPFNTGVDFLFTKITIVIILLLSLANLKKLYSIKKIKRYTSSIFLFFMLLTFMSYNNRTLIIPEFFNLPFFLNLLVFIIVINMGRNDPQTLLRCLYFFSISSLIMTLLYFGGMESESVIENRVTVFGNNQNEMGLNLAISILIFLSFIFEDNLKSRKFKYLLYIAIPLMLIFLVRTGSRVAFICLFTGVITFFLLKQSKIKGTKIFIVFLLIFVLFFIWDLYLKNSYLAERLFLASNEGDLSGRDIIWAASFEIILKNPFMGLGETGYANQIEPILNYFSSPHNVIIEVLCYTGIIGLTFFLFFLFSIINCAIRVYKIKQEILPLLLLIPIIGMILSAQILGTKIAWVIFAFIISRFYSDNLNYKRDSIIKNTH
jgi:O-antigen ligase